MRSSPFWPLLLLFSLAESVTFYGPTIATSIFEDLRATFALTGSDNVTYEAISTDANSYLSQGKPVIVTKADNTLNSSLTIPMFGFPLVVVYNIRTVAVQLTQQLLIDILRGRITRWNDPNMISANPNVTLPNQTITLVIGSFLDLFEEGMSVLAGEPFSITAETINVGTRVCAKVRANPYHMGLSWMGDALVTNVQLALLENADRFFVSPSRGSPTALSEFYLTAKSAAPGTVVLPYNMHGRLTWPLVGIFYVVLPQQFPDCSQLRVVQSFLSTTLFRTTNMDTFVQVIGWQPAKVLLALDQTLGVVEEEHIDYRELLFSLPCGEVDMARSHKVGASSDLGPGMLKLLAAFAGEYDSTLILSSSTNITFLLNGMIRKDQTVDMVFTWDFVLTPYKELYSVPVLMGSVVPFVNFGGAPLPTLSVSVLADIFLGVITYWNDTRIQVLNGDLMPSEPIVLFAARNTSLDGRTGCFASLLARSVPGFNWTQINRTTSTRDILPLVEFTPYSIGYGFTRSVENVTAQVPKLIGATNQSVSLSPASLAACWTSFKHPNCWPMATPLSLAIRRPDDSKCRDQKRLTDFAYWVSSISEGPHPLMVPNLSPSETLGPVEYCGGRSLIATKPELQILSSGAKYLVYVLCAIALCWATCQAIALGVARKRAELKSASVLFSLVAVVGAFLILITPLLVVQDDPSASNCGSAIWLLVLGFSLCFGGIFAKLFRLYTIFTSRKLVVPRLSNRRLLLIVLAFLIVDVILLLVFSIVTPSEPHLVSARFLASEDLVTGHREFILKTCSFEMKSPVLWIIIIFKFFVALCGAGMAFSIRQVDKRFTSSSALGLAFYNLFLGCGIAVIIELLFDSTDSLEFLIFIPVFCGLWIMYITLLALTFDSNVLMACKDFSRPLRKILTGASDSKESKEQKDSRKSISDKGPQDNKAPDSKSGTVFVLNREMFPSQYDKFEGELLDQILEELNFQRAAVRRAIVNTSMPSTVSVGDPDKDPHRLTFQGRADSPPLPRRSQLQPPQRRSVVTTAESPRRSENGLQPPSPSSSIDLPELSVVQMSSERSL